MHEIPDELVVNTTKYKMLQTQFNLLFNDAQTVGNIFLCYHKNFKQMITVLMNAKCDMANWLEDMVTEIEALRIPYHYHMY